MFFTKKIICFFRLASTKSYQRAAEALYVTPEAVKYSIALLERDYGQKLFFKNKSGVHLTKEGENLYERIKPLYDEFNTILKNLRLLNGKNQIVRIKTDGLYNPAVYSWLNIISKNHNGKLIVTQSDYNSLIDLKNNLCDISICTMYGEYLPAENEMNSVILSQSSVGLLVHKNHFVKDKGCDELILNHVFYQRSEFLEQTLYYNITNRLNDSGYYPNIVGLIEFEDVINMVRSGSGVTMLMSSALDFIKNKDELFYITSPFSFEIKVITVLYFRKNATKEVLRIAEILQQKASSHHV